MKKSTARRTVTVLVALIVAAGLFIGGMALGYVAKSHEWLNKLRGRLNETVRAEAEAGELAGGASVNEEDDERIFVTDLTEGRTITFTVTVGEDCEATLRICLGAPEEDSTLSDLVGIEVNGQAAAQGAVVKGAKAGTWREVKVGTIELTKGENTIVLSGKRGADVDFITLTAKRSAELAFKAAPEE